MFNNTKLFSEAAEHFKKYGFYCPDPPDTIGYDKYWDEQEKRCREGYTVGNFRITGAHYFYLNFCQIKLTDTEKIKEAIETKDVTKRGKTVDFPRFWDGDYEYFHAIEKARLAGKHLIVDKCRRRGYSYKNAAVGTYDYNFIRNSFTIVGAYEKKYLYPNGTMAMINSYMNFLNQSTAWSKRRDEINRIDHKRASFVVTNPITGITTTGGYKSEVMAITYKDNPDAARGKDASLILFEEAGKFDNLKSSYLATKPCVEDGNETIGTILVFGCVCAGTKVWTAKGVQVNIEDLQQEQGIIGYAGTGVIQQQIIWMKPPAEKPCYRIKTTSGAVLECSDDHPLLWSKNKFDNSAGNKKVTFKRADELQVGEQLMTVVQVPIFGKTKVQEARLLGLMLGDGYYGNGTAEVSICGEDLDRWINGLGIPLSVHKQFKTKEGRDYKSYTMPQMHKYLAQFGMYGQSKEHKQLPNNIDSFDLESVSEFLGGYFDADGSVHYNAKKNVVRVVLTSKHLHLLEGVKKLLFKLRISCAIVKETRKSGYKPGAVYRLYVSKVEDVKQFRKHIKFVSSDKQTTLEKIDECTKNSRYFYDNCEFVPSESTNKGTFYTNSKLPLNSLKAETITSIEFIGMQPVYNLNAGVTHTYITNNFISGNTGGDMEGGSIDFSEMFYDPEPYNFMAFENVWDEAAGSTFCGYFVPDYMNKQGFIDADGNSDKLAAIKYEEEKREQIKKAKDPTVLTKHLSEYPFCPAESFLVSNFNILPIAQLQIQEKKLMTNPMLQSIGTPGKFVRVEGRLTFKPDYDLKPITEFPLKAETDTTGCPVVYFDPYRVDGEVPSGLYYIGHDPYAQDSGGLSLGAAYVLCRPNRYTQPDDIIVAEYVGRPQSQDEYNRILFDLAEYYNAKIGFENDRGEVIPYAKRYKRLHQLQEEFQMLSNKELQSSHVNRGYGMHMTDKRKDQGEIYLRDWLNTVVTVTREGKVITNVDRIYSIALCRELIRFNKKKGNFDRVMALLVAMYHSVELYDKEIQEPASRSLIDSWFDSNYEDVEDDY